MKFIAAIVLSALLGYLVYIFNNTLPWWGVAVAAFIAGATIPQKAGFSWLSGFLGIALLWAVLAWWLDKENTGILSARMAQVLPFGGNTTLMLAATALVGGLVGGFGALTGAFIRKKAD